MLSLRWLMSILLAAVLLINAGLSPAENLAFEDRCQSIDAWTLIDLQQGGKAFVENDPTVPPGYGPQVIRLRGDETLLIANGVRFTQGTLLVLWKDEEPIERDCDGVLLFEAEYADDLTIATNTRERRPHTWIEQDDDTGFQIKHQEAEQKDLPLIVKGGVGKTQEPWNKTGWIWQKLRIADGRIRAKFWSTAAPEPEEWAIDQENWTPKEGRLGLKVWSGHGSIAYYAVSPGEDLHPPLAPLEITLPRMLWFQGEIPQVRLFLNLNQPVALGMLRLSGTQGGLTAVETETEVPLPSGHTEITFGPGEESNQFPLPDNLDQGPAVLTAQLLDDDGQEIAKLSRTLEFRSADFYRNRFDNLLARIAAILEAESEPRSDRALEALAARALLARATASFAEANIRLADRALAYAEEALSTDFAVAPWTIEEVELPAQSWTMGQTYQVPIAWKHLAEKPAGTLLGRLELVDDLEMMTAAAQEVSLDPGKWTAGSQTAIFALSLPTESSADPEQPLSVPQVREGFHRLFLSLSDPQTGSPVWMDLPKPERGGFTRRYEIGRVYVSQAPVEIRGLATRMEAGLESATVVIKNLSDQPMKTQVGIRVLSESGTVLATEVRDTLLEGGQESRIEAGFEDLSWFGPLTVEVKALEGSRLLTRAERSVKIPPPAGWQVEVSRTEKAWRTPEKNYTNLLFEAAPPEGWKQTVTVPIDIRHKGLDWGSFQRKVGPGDEKSFELGVTPGIGTYQVTVAVPDAKGRNWKREFRILAPVFENHEGSLHLNGEPFIVKGTNVHGLIGQSPRRTRMVLELLKDLGFNMVRGDYPPTWEVEMAEEIGLGWLVLAPFSVTNTDALKERYQADHPFARMREVTRRFIRTYRDFPATWFWNSCNEVTGEIDDFLVSLYPLYKAMDPAHRPVVYANLTGQDRTVGQDLVGINYYYDRRSTVEDRQPLVADSIETAKKAGLPVIYNEFNTWHGPVYSQGAASLRGFFEWGIEKGMAGGFYYQLRDDHDRHPGIISDDDRVWTSPTLEAALHQAFDDADVSVKSRTSGQIALEIENLRPFALRRVSYEVREGTKALGQGTLPDFKPEDSQTLSLGVEEGNRSHELSIELRFETHHGIQEKVKKDLFVSSKP